MGRRLRRPRAARRAGSSARSPTTSSPSSDAVDRVRADTGPRRPPRRLLAGRDVLLPGRRLPPRRGHRERDHLRQPRRHARRRCRSACPRSSRSRGAGLLADGVLAARRACPAWASRTGFRLLDPVKSLRQRVDFLPPAPRPRGAAAARAPAPVPRGARAGSRGPGPALADFMRQFVAHNRMLSGGFVIDDRLVTLADIDVPDPDASSARSTRSRRRAAVRAVAPRRAARRRLRGRRCAPGTSASSSARPRCATTWPTSPRGRAGATAAAPRPTGSRCASATRTPDRPTPGGRRARRRTASSSPPGSAPASRARSSRRPRARRAAPRSSPRGGRGQLPRLARLERVQPRHPDLARPAARRAGAEARPTTSSSSSRTAPTPTPPPSAASTTSSRGLISLGVRQGEHVGVLMDTRPERADGRRGAEPPRRGRACCCAPTATSRREAELGQVDAGHRRPRARRASAAGGAEQVLVLGGGGDAARPRRRRCVDMERIDPDEVALPAWYRPNPGRARDLAFILFTGDGRAHPRRTGSPTAAGRSRRSARRRRRRSRAADTVYARHADPPPLGAADERSAARSPAAPGSRWPATSTRRRSGTRSAATASTVVSYTWTMLRELVDAPPRPGRAPPPGAAFIGLRHAARAVAARQRALRARARARVLRLHRGRGDARQRVRREGRRDGPAAAGQRRACASPPTTSPTRPAGRGRRRLRASSARAARSGCCCARASGRDAPPATSAAARRVRAATTRGWRPATCSAATRTATSGWSTTSPALIRTAARPGRRASRSTTRSATSMRSTSRSPTASQPAAGEIAVAAVTLRARPHPPSMRMTSRATAGAPRRSVPAVVHVVDEIPVTTWYRPCGAAAQARPARRQPPRLGPRRRRLPDVHGCRSRAARRQRGAPVALVSADRRITTRPERFGAQWATREPSGSRPVPVVGSV